MADKTYRMTVGLSNGSTLDAGTFIAPQGPAGSLLNWSAYKTANDFSLPENEYGVYLIDRKSTTSNMHEISFLVYTQEGIETGGIFFKNNFSAFRIDTYFIESGIEGISETTITMPDSETSVNLMGASRVLEVSQLTGNRFAYAKLISF